MPQARELTLDDDTKVVEIDRGHPAFPHDTTEKMAWLADGDGTAPHWQAGQWWRGFVEAEHVCGWADIIAIRILRSHPYADAILAGMKPHTGSESEPEDYDGRWVMFRSGLVSDRGLIWRWSHLSFTSDIIGYHIKQPTTPAQSVSPELVEELRWIKDRLEKGDAAGSAINLLGAVSDVCARIVTILTKLESADPDLLLAREEAEKVSQTKGYLTGERDRTELIRGILAAIKRTRELAKHGGTITFAEGGEA